MTNTKTQALAELLQQAGHAHHEAFLEVDGADPEWPLWYAEFLQEKLNQILGQDLTRSRIVYELIRLDETEFSGEEPWPQAYARDLVEKFAGS